MRLTMLVFGFLVWGTGGVLGEDPPCRSYELELIQDRNGEELESIAAFGYDREVESATEICRLTECVVSWMSRELRFSVTQPVEVRICSRFESDLSAKVDPESPTAGSFLKEGDGGVIVLRQGLPTRRLVQIIAHEWVHVWQSENCPDHQDLLIHEGLAQWGAAELLKMLSLSDDLEVLRNREDFYGEAYRWAAEFERKAGRRALLDYVRTAR